MMAQPSSSIARCGASGGRFAGGPAFLRRAIEARLLDRLDDTAGPLGGCLCGRADGVLAEALRGRAVVERVVAADELSRPFVTSGLTTIDEESCLRAIELGRS
jgi:hypothetical protein